MLTVKLVNCLRSQAVNVYLLHKELPLRLGNCLYGSETVFKQTLTQDVGPSVYDLQDIYSYRKGNKAGIFLS